MPLIRGMMELSARQCQIVAAVPSTLAHLFHSLALAFLFSLACFTLLNIEYTYISPLDRQKREVDRKTLNHDIRGSEKNQQKERKRGEEKGGREHTFMSTN